MKRIKLKNIHVRRIGQWALLTFLIFVWIRGIFDEHFFFNFEACCPFGGLQSIATFINNGALACTMGGMQVVMAGLLALGVIFVSKLFCGYVCPIGTISEGLGRLGKRLKLPHFEAGGILDIALRSLKYILLFLTFYFTLESNDLFCKKFDPFYAIATRYGDDVSAWMATLAIALLVVGAIFLRQFWCRYLCPLGAISSAFKYFYVFVAWAIVIIVLGQASVEVDLAILLGLIALSAYVLEIVGLKNKAGFQLLKVKRDEHACISCGLCDKKCPQGIIVSTVPEVNHPDCNLCAECIDVCPVEDTLAINGKPKFRWLPILITIALIMIGLVLGANLAIPTVDMNWGEDKQEETSAVYEMSGLKHVKCYGSSVSFSEKMKKVPGVIGVETYVKDHRVVISYDSTMMSQAQVRESIFTPKFFDIRIPSNEAEVYITDYYIENFFDEMDVVFAANLLRENKNVYSFESIYGDPVKVRVYSDSLLDMDSVAMSIENSSLVYSTPEESFSSRGLYRIAHKRRSDTIYSGAYLKSLSFPRYSRAFNGRSQYTNDQMDRIIFPISDYPRNSQLMPYITNHLGKANKYIVGLVAQYSSSGPVTVVFYVKDKVSEEEIIDLMCTETIKVSYDNGVIEKLKNPYVFETPEK